MKARSHQRHHHIRNDGDDLRSRQIRFDSGESYLSCCSKPRCKNRPDYHYSFEVFSVAYDNWQQRDYFYCGVHMEATCKERGLELPLLTVTEVSGSGDVVYRCMYCGGGTEWKRTRGRDLFFVECSVCRARGPDDRCPSLAVAKWNAVCQKVIAQNSCGR